MRIIIFLHYLIVLSIKWYKKTITQNKKNDFIKRAYRLKQIFIFENPFNLQLKFTIKNFTKIRFFSNIFFIFVKKILLHVKK